MSQQDLEIVRRLNEAFNSRSEGWAADFYASGAEMRMPPEWVEESAYVGPEGIQRLGEKLLESFDELRWDLDRVIDADGCVVGLFHQRGRIKDGGSWVEAPIGTVFYMDDGKVARAVVYFSWSAALQAAGVAE